MAVIETQLEELKKDYDWIEAFGQGSGGNMDRSVDIVPPDSKVSTDYVDIAGIAEVIACVNGENEGADWVGVFRFNDGRFAVVSAGCDYTGWDCQASNSISVAATLDDAIRFGLNDGERARLGLSLPA